MNENLKAVLEIHLASKDDLHRSLRTAINCLKQMQQSVNENYVEISESSELPDPTVMMLKNDLLFSRYNAAMREYSDINRDLLIAYGKLASALPCEVDDE